MSQISKIPLKKGLEQNIRKLFCDSVASCSSSVSATELIEDLLTPVEQIMLAKRIAIAHLLIQQKSYDQIRSLLHVSTPTIGSVSRLLKTQGSGLRGTLQSLMKNPSWKKFFSDIDTMALAYRIFPSSKTKHISKETLTSTSKAIVKIST